MGQFHPDDVVYFGHFGKVGDNVVSAAELCYLTSVRFVQRNGEFNF